MAKKGIALFVWVMVLLVSANAWGTGYYVTPDGNDDANGLSWATAFETIQKGIYGAGDGNVVDVNAGTYYENIDFNGVACTLKSTNPDDWDVVEATIIDANGSGYVVVFDSSEGADSILTGFTITGGNGTWAGGINCYGGDPTISKCIIRNNEAAYTGGGIRCMNSEAIISNCIIADNESGYDGGGVFCDSSSPAITNCLIFNNAGLSEYGSGGGMYLGTYSCGTITSCTITSNTSAGDGGGIYTGTGCDPVITNSIFWGNSAVDEGNEVYNYSSGDPNFSYCDVAGSGGSGSWDPNFGSNDGVNIDSDPCFVDADSNDYGLKVGSPCVNTGDPNGNYSGQVDIDFEDRVQTTRIEMGADEIFVPVHNVDKNKTYAAINDGIDDASNGDTIVVYPGTFYENVDFDGKAITVTSANPNNWEVIEATIIDANGSGTGVAFDSSEDANSVISGFTITGGDASFGKGGGITCSSADPVITKCIIKDNDASYNGGGIYCYSADPNISNCIITDNNAVYDGGGIWCDGSDPTITSCIISGNEAGSYGGGIYCAAYSDPTITNCTINGNTADKGGAIYSTTGCNALVRNSILWGNTATTDGNEVCNYSTADPNFMFCNIKDSNGSAGWDPNFGSDDSNNIDSDPCFVDADSNDYHLTIESPCVNTGDPNGSYTGQRDVDIQARVIGSGIDIGADEFGPVHNITKDLKYPTINGAIDDANNGDIIVVFPGTYYENVDFDGKAITVRSADPNNWEVVWATIINANGSGTVVKFESSEDANSVITGFTITNGYGKLSGGGIKCKEASPTISKCLIKSNYDEYAGGGIFCISGADAEISNCIITDNDSGYDGGGIYCDNSDPNISNCIITDNNAVYDGGGIHFTDYSRSPIVTNCTITSNTAGDDGGGMYTYLGSNPIITNSIFWGNTAADDGNEVYNASTGDPNFSYCDIKDSGGSNTWDPNLGSDDGNNIYHNPCFVNANDLDGADNIFGTLDDGLMLDSNDSPCIDVADGNLAPEKDIRGKGRYDDPNAANAGYGDPNYVDMGAYENQTPSNGNSASSVYFSGWCIGDGETRCNVESVPPFSMEEGFPAWTSHVIEPGEYTNLSNGMIRNAAETSLDGIAIREGTRVIIYEHRDFEGDVLMDVNGPAIVYNITRQNDPEECTPRADWVEPYQTDWPQSVRYYSDIEAGNMNDWVYHLPLIYEDYEGASLKIIEAE